MVGGSNPSAGTNIFNGLRPESPQRPRCTLFGVTPRVNFSIKTEESLQQSRPLVAGSERVLFWQMALYRKSPFARVFNNLPYPQLVGKRGKLLAVGVDLRSNPIDWPSQAADSPDRSPSRAPVAPPSPETAGARAGIRRCWSKNRLCSGVSPAPLWKMGKRKVPLPEAGLIVSRPETHDLEPALIAAINSYRQASENRSQKHHKPGLLPLAKDDAYPNIRSCSL